MLEVKRTTNECEKTTENGVYRVVYSVSENRLENLSVTVFNKTMVEIPGGNVNASVMPGAGTAEEQQAEPLMQEQLIMIGNLSMNNEQIAMYCFPYTEKYTVYMADFDSIVKEVLSILNPAA